MNPSCRARSSSRFQPRRSGVSLCLRARSAFRYPCSARTSGAGLSLSVRPSTIQTSRSTPSCTGRSTRSSAAARPVRARSSPPQQRRNRSGMTHPVTLTTIRSRYLKRLSSRLQRLSRREGRTDRPVVEVIELTADRYALRQRGQRHAPLKLIGDVMRRCQAIDRGVEGQDHFGDAFAFHPVDQFRDAELFRSLPGRARSGCRPARDKAP